MNTQTYSFSQSQNIPQPSSNSVNFNGQPRSSQEQSKNYPFFLQNKNNTNRYHIRNQPPYYTTTYFPSDDEEYYNQNMIDFIRVKDLLLTTLTNQMFSNHTHEMNKYNNLEIIQHLTKIIFINKTQSIHNLSNQLKCITKSH